MGVFYLGRQLGPGLEGAAVQEGAFLSPRFTGGMVTAPSAVPVGGRLPPPRVGGQGQQFGVHCMETLRTDAKTGRRAEDSP